MLGTEMLPKARSVSCRVVYFELDRNQIRIFMKTLGFLGGMPSYNSTGGVFTHYLAFQPPHHLI